MTIWLVTCNYPYEGPVAASIWASLEEAKQEVARLVATNIWEDVDVYEMKLGAPCLLPGERLKSSTQ